MRRKKSNKLILIIIVLVLLLLVGVGIYYLLNKKDKDIIKEDKNTMIKLNTLEEANTFAKDKNIKININYDYSDTIEKDKIISQSIKEGDSLKDITELTIEVSLGKLDKEKLASDGINELGRVPIMMYHGIREKTKNSTGTVEEM